LLQDKKIRRNAFAEPFARGRPGIDDENAGPCLSLAADRDCRRQSESCAQNATSYTGDVELIALRNFRSLSTSLAWFAHAEAFAGVDIQVAKLANNRPT
jgi:hypothetical protein